MDDRTLLTKAAKAAGLNIKYWAQDDYPVVFDGDQHVGWNPLKFDSDALRLAVKLHLDINQFPVTESEGFESCMGIVEVWRNGDSDPIRVELLQPGDDRYAATRRAITRAAAALAGK